MSPDAPALRRPLERVALLLLHGAPATPSSGVIGLTAVLDTDDVNGRGVELSRLLAIHSSAPVALVEANLRHRSRLAAAMGMDSGPGLLDALRDPARTAEVVRPTPDPRLWVMTAGSTAPSHAPVGAARLGEVVAVVRAGEWAVARRVLDLQADEDQRRWSAPRPEAAALVGAPDRATAAGSSEQPAPPAPRPFNEGPPVGDPGAAAPPGPPGPPGPAGSPGPATSPSLAPPFAPPPRLQVSPTAVVLAPPLDDASDGDVVISQCDEVLLLVHTGRVTREQVADAAARIGRDRLAGTILVQPARSRRR
jgi:hypothetical protein